MRRERQASRQQGIEGFGSETSLDASPFCLDDLPRGVIVGSAVISKCVPNGEPSMYEWHLTGVKRYKRPRQLKHGVRPQPVWFRLS